MKFLFKKTITKTKSRKSIKTTKTPLHDYDCVMTVYPRLCFSTTMMTISPRLWWLFLHDYDDYFSTTMMTISPRLWWLFLHDYDDYFSTTMMTISPRLWWLFLRDYKWWPLLQVYADYFFHDNVTIMKTIFLRVHRHELINWVVMSLPTCLQYTSHVRCISRKISVENKNTIYAAIRFQSTNAL